MISHSPKKIELDLETGFEYLRAGNLDQASIIANQSLSDAPEHPGVLNFAGLVAQQQGDFNQAAELLQRAIAIDTSNAIYFCNLGAVYAQLHQYAEAIATCQHALQLRPNYSQALITLGSSYFATEQYSDALNAYQQAVALNPENARYQSYCGDALRELGQIRAAIETYEKALELAPNLPYTLANLGLTLLGVGQSEQALAYCQQATQYEPDNSNHWMNLGTVFRILGDVENAMDAYGNAYQLSPDSAVLCTLIGQIWQEVEDFSQALLWFDQALAIEADRLDTRCLMAEVILERGDVETAIALFEDLRQQNPTYYPTLLGLSKAFWEDGNVDDAVAIAREAADLRPEDARIQSHLATLLASAGDVEAANLANREALAVNPNCIIALVNLAQNLRSKLPEADAQTMQTLLDADWAGDGARAALHFGLAHYYDGCKNYAQAASHCIQANALHSAYKQARGWNYNPDDYAHYIDQVIQHFTPDFFQRTQGLGSDSSTPIFIVGMPRSGTTLTEQILASHPAIFGVGERTLSIQGFNRLPGVMDAPAGTKVWEVIDTIEASHIQQLATWHLDHLTALATKANLDPQHYRYIVDKMPDNFSVLGWLATLFPKAKVIHCRRNVRDVAVSCWMTQFKSMKWSFDLTHIAERIRQYWRVMEHWRQTLPIPMLEIDYEETVADQAGQTARLLDFIGLEWDDACLQFHTTERLVRTASVTQVRQPIYTRSLERWRHYEEALQPLLERLGTD